MSGKYGGAPPMIFSVLGFALEVVQSEAPQVLTGVSEQLGKGSGEPVLSFTGIVSTRGWSPLLVVVLNILGY